MSTSNEFPIFRLAGRKLETFNLGGKATTFEVVENNYRAELTAPKSAHSLAVAQRLHGDWYAEVSGKSFCVSAVAADPADCINAAFAKAASL